MHQKEPVAFTSLIMCHSLIERSQFCSEHRELLLLLGMWVGTCMLCWKCIPALFIVSLMILYGCVLPASYLRSECVLTLLYFMVFSSFEATS